MIVRRANMLQLGTVLDVQRRSYGKVMWSAFPIIIEQVFRHGEMYLIYDDDVAIGFMHFRRVRKNWRHIINVCVVDSHQGEGVARRGLSHIHARFYELGVTRVTLETSEENESARKLFTTLGYTEFGRVPNYYKSGYFDGSAAIQMCLDLTREYFSSDKWHM